MKVIKINVEDKTITEIEIDGSLNSIYEAIGNGCTTFTSPIYYDNDDAMYCDDESLLRPSTIQGAFIYPNWNYPIVSNAIIIGTDSEGGSISCKSTINMIKKDIRFIDKDNPNLVRYIQQFV